MSSLQASEKECAAVAVAPRVALADIEAAVKQRWDVNGADAVHGVADAKNGPLAIMSLCFLQMRNGFVVVGKSAPASPTNFNADLGRKLAYEDCVRQLWPLMGYALRERISHERG